MHHGLDRLHESSLFAGEQATTFHPQALRKRSLRTYRNEQLRAVTMLVFHISWRSGTRRLSSPKPRSLKVPQNCKFPTTHPVPTAVQVMLKSPSPGTGRVEVSAAALKEQTQQLQDSKLHKSFDVTTANRRTHKHMFIGIKEPSLMAKRLYIGPCRLASFISRSSRIYCVLPIPLRITSCAVST